MDRIAVDPFEYLPQILSGLKKPGLLLVSGKNGNPMTIGWATAGIIWEKPVFTVLVRPSRYSFELLEENGEFTVNVPSADDREMAYAAKWCGSRSGRNYDKCAELNLVKEPGIVVDVPYLAGSIIHLECRTVHKNDISEQTLDYRIAAEHYSGGNFHRIWWGEILGAWKAAGYEEADK